MELADKIFPVRITKGEVTSLDDLAEHLGGNVKQIVLMNNEEGVGVASLNETNHRTAFGDFMPFFSAAIKAMLPESP